MILRTLMMGLILCVAVNRVAAESPLPWMLVTMEKDLRDDEMKSCDEGFEQNKINGINETGKLPQKIVLVKTPISKMLDATCPFGVLHFDSVKPGEFTPLEKTNLEEFFKRGGFVLFIEDTYPYEQEVFRQKRDLPVFDFITKELPAKDPAFTIERAGDDHAVFGAFYKTGTDPAIALERLENPNYRGRTMLLYKKRLVAFFMGQYGAHDGNRWVPMERPLEPYVGRRPGFELTVNLYVYTMSH